MKIWKVIFLSVLYFNSVFGEFVHLSQFYPSQSLVDSFNDKRKYINRKAEIKHGFNKLDKKDNEFSQNKSTINWRNFNEDFKLITNLKTTRKRAADPVFHGHPKTQEELWNEHFLYHTTAFDQTPALIKLIHNITLAYFNDCVPVILYDKLAKEKESYLFQDLLRNFPVSYIHGYINDNGTLQQPKLIIPVQECLHFIVFVTEVKMSAKVLGKQSKSKVVVVTRSSQWAIHEFLASSLARGFINLLVIGQSFEDETLEAPYILYTHKLYTDGLGASKPKVLTSWSHGKFSRNLNLFPTKMRKGYAGHRFVVAAAHQPPFVIRRIKTDLDGGNPRVAWDGIEIRLVKLLAERNNFSIEFMEPRELQLGSGNAVAKEVALGRADIGIAGMYATKERLRDMDTTFAHSHDCAAFITLMSTALPRYRAILGPFHWHVWVALTLTYLFGMFPLAFSDKHTLRHLLHDSGEIENMFWYVFGTFTNCFTFVGKNSWSKTTKITTRILIGWYWIFTIIITSCYTGSIIAFVTLPTFPETVDTVDQMLSGFYRVGTLEKGGWEEWFVNSSDPQTRKLLKKLEFVPTVESGIRNTTKAFFWPYAFLGSRAELNYIIKTNYTKAKSKRALLHISNECFVPFGVVMGFPNNSLHSNKLRSDISRMVQSGIIDKIVDEVRWEMLRSPTGGYLAVSSNANLRIQSAEEKGLTLEDTQGMFLLLGAGFLMGAAALISEWMGGFGKKCRITKKTDDEPSSASSRQNLVPPTPNESTRDVLDDIESHLHFSTRSSTAESKETLNGQIINVTQENIIVHNDLDTNNWCSRRSSSVDLDREVREIFEKDFIRRGIVEEVIDITTDDGTFGHRISSNIDFDKNEEDKKGHINDNESKNINRIIE